MPPPDLLFATKANMTVQNVQGPIVTVQQTVWLKNQSYPNVRILTGNVSSGSGNLEYWIVSGGLVKGDKLYRDTNAFVSNFIINETVPKVYAGAVRTVNIVNNTYTSAVAGFQISLNQTAIFDQQTGILLELTQKSFSSFSYPGGSNTFSKADTHILITNTSLWKGSTTPGFVVISNATEVIIGQNTNTVVQLTVFSLNHFQGTVTFATHVTSQGPDATVVPASVTLAADGIAYAILTITGHNTPIGRFNVNVTGTSQAVISNVTTNVNVQLPRF
jgi:hypothetical protein